MGGNAIKIAERVKRDKFFKYSEEIIPRVESAFNTKVAMVNGYHNKQDFGDLDLLVLHNPNITDRKEVIEQEFSPLEINVNSNIISFNYNELQVDLIFTTEENWLPSNYFFHWGDLGNFIGKIVNSYGNLNRHGYSLKYGFDGLKCKLKVNGKIKHVYITRDSKKVFKFLSLSLDQWLLGFNEKEDMFDYVIGSPLFSYDSFQWENLNSINRERNKKRPNYYKFLEYIEPYSDRVIEWGSDINEYLENVKNFFNKDLVEEMNIFKKEIETEKKIKSKFNGKLVMDKYPNLVGKELGYFIDLFKSSYTDFSSFVLDNTEEDIMESFSKLLEKERSE